MCTSYYSRCPQRPEGARSSDTGIIRCKPSDMGPGNQTHNSYRKGVGSLSNWAISPTPKNENILMVCCVWYVYAHVCWGPLSIHAYRSHSWAQSALFPRLFPARCLRQGGVGCFSFTLHLPVWGGSLIPPGAHYWHVHLADKSPDLRISSSQQCLAFYVGARI